VFNHDLVLRRLRPFSAPAILGTAAHAALAMLARAKRRGVRISGGERLTGEIAREAFDEALAAECRRRDEMVRSRGQLPGEDLSPPTSLPFYAINGARLARFAQQRYGASWPWLLHLGTPAKSNQRLSNERTGNIHGPEVALQSADGLINGVADSIIDEGSTVAIEEFKTGEASPDNVRDWRYQLLIYGKLYADEHGRAPSHLRIHSLASGTQQFEYVDDEARQTVASVSSALRELNRRISNGVDVVELARPNPTNCRSCPHRPWCQPYWSASTPGADGTDLEGTIEAEGFQGRMRASSGAMVEVDFRPLRISPNVGAQIRICSARPARTGIVCDVGTAIWRVAA
jgi:CRISPR/Cas system-associated exonuclease Cas4 (RecB family)